MLKSSMSLTPFLGQDLTAYRIDNTVYSITYRHRIRQRKPFHKNPLSKRLLSQLLTGDPEQVQRLAPSFSQSMGISLHKGCSHLRPWCAHGIFRSRKSRQSVFFPSSRPTLKKDSRHLRVAAFCIERQQMSDPALRACQKSDASLLTISRRSLLLCRTKLTSDVSRPVRAVSDFLSGSTDDRDRFVFGSPPRIIELYQIFSTTLGAEDPVRFVGPDPRRTGRTRCSPTVRP